MVPADCRLIKAENLEVDESLLTGESLPVIKHSEKCLQKNSPLAERNNMLFMSTYVTKGTGIAIVTATGQHTEIGKLAGVLQRDTPSLTPLQRELDGLGKKLAAGSLVVCSGS